MGEVPTGVHSHPVISLLTKFERTVLFEWVYFDLTIHKAFDELICSYGMSSAWSAEMDGEVSLSPCKWNLVPREQFSIEAAISSSVIRRKSARSSCLRPNEHNVRLEPHGAVN